MEWGRRSRADDARSLLATLDELPRVHFWRGSADGSWPLDPTIVRRIRRHSVASLREPSEGRIVSSELRLLERARHQGYGVRDGVRLTDLELLALLRHHGAATRLVDFSRSAPVALWFACCAEPDRDGQLVGINTEYVWGGAEGAPLELESESDSYEEVMAEVAKSGGLWQWQPTDVTPRVAAQHSQLLFSGFVNAPHGSLLLPNDRDDAVAVIDIPSDLKAAILLSLKKIFDIRHVSMFPDIYGFSETFSAAADDDERW